MGMKTESRVLMAQSSIMKLVFSWIEEKTLKIAHTKTKKTNESIASEWVNKRQHVSFEIHIQYELNSSWHKVSRAILLNEWLGGWLAVGGTMEQSIEFSTSAAYVHDAMDFKKRIFSSPFYQEVKSFADHIVYIY